MYFDCRNNLMLMEDFFSEWSHFGDPLPDVPHLLGEPDGLMPLPESLGQFDDGIGHSQSVLFSDTPLALVPRHMHSESLNEVHLDDIDLESFAWPRSLSSNDNHVLLDPPPLNACDFPFEALEPGGVHGGGDPGASAWDEKKVEMLSDVGFDEMNYYYYMPIASDPPPPPPLHACDFPFEALEAGGVGGDDPGAISWDENKVEEPVDGRTSRLSYLGLDEIKNYFYMPITKAAKEMNVGLTVLKKRCRELGIARWPHRKMKSLKSLIHNVQELGKGVCDDSIGRELETLEEHRRMMEENPEMQLTERTKKLRQACFKANYKKRRLLQQPCFSIHDND